MGVVGARRRHQQKEEAVLLVVCGQHDWRAPNRLLVVQCRIVLIFVKQKFSSAYSAARTVRQLDQLAEAPDEPAERR